MVTGVAGTIDGGASTDTVLITFDASQRLNTAVLLPTNFENLALVRADGVTVTLADGFSTDGALGLGNGGTLRNETSLSGDGTVIARMQVSGSAPSVENAGTITSTGSTGDYALDLGVVSSFTNTGTISSSGTGVQLGRYGVLNNLAGGVVQGDTMALSLAESSNSMARIYNAGTIERDVSIGDSTSSRYGNYNIFYALDGGILNGNLSLGDGDYLVTSLDNEGEGDFAGINGAVNASSSQLRYEVTRDTSAVLALPDGFASVGYQFTAMPH